MEKIFSHVCLLGGLLLSFQTSAQQVNPTHIARVWKTDMDEAKFVEEVISTLRQTHEANVETGLPGYFHYNIKQWTQQDITDFAKSGKTFDFFENLLGIGNDAIEKDNTGQFTAKAIEAQMALTYLKPDCCKSWKGFCNMIANAADETESLRLQYRKKMEAQRR